MISIRHVYQTFGSRQILKDVSLTVKDGETMVILGASGSGKSTLLKLIIGLLKPTSGEVMVNGKDMARLSEAELNHERRHMGFVFQYSALFDSMTVKENVAFGLRMHTKMSEEEIDRIVKEKLHLVAGWHREFNALQFIRRHEEKGQFGQGHCTGAGNHPLR